MFDRTKPRSSSRLLRVVVLAGVVMALVTGTVEAAPLVRPSAASPTDSRTCSVPITRCAPAVQLPAGYDYYDRVDDSWIPQPQNVLESHLLDYARQIPGVLWEACISTDSSGKGEGYTTHVVGEARLQRLIEDPEGRAQLNLAFTGTPSMSDPGHRYQDCLDKRAPGWRTPAAGQPDAMTTTPGWTKVIDDVEHVPPLSGKPGTDDTTPFFCRTGGGDEDEWDFTMSLLLRVWALMKDEPSKVLFGVDDDAKKSALAADVAKRAWLEGSAQDIDATVCTRVGVAITETENHEWLIRTTRFLHNELLPMDIYPGTEIGEYVEKYNRDTNNDNNANGLAAYIKGILTGVLDHDWLEYNARPYVKYEMIGLFNLYDFSTDPTIKQLAGTVLNFMALKHASESIDNERIEPYRRKKEKESPNLFQDDTTGPMFETWVGGLSEPVFPKAGAGGITDMITLAASTSYRPPSWMVDTMLNRAHRGNMEYFDGRDQGEIGYTGPDFAITGGGQLTPCPYPGGVIDGCFGAGNDHGTVEPLVLIPHRVRVPDGAGAAIAEYPNYGGDIHTVGLPGESNDCVYRNFFCTNLDTVSVPDVIKNSSCTINNMTPADDGGDPGGDPPDLRLLLKDDSVYTLDGHCLGPAYAETCILVYKADVTLGGAWGSSYVIAHSCDPKASDDATAQAAGALETYMRGAGKADATMRTCGTEPPRQQEATMTLAMPPLGPVNLTGAEPGEKATVRWNEGACAAGTDAGQFYVVTGATGPNGANIHGDLTLAGGRNPVTAISASSTVNHTSYFGQSVPLTAVIAADGRTDETGTVTFLDGTHVLGTAPVAEGEASLPVSDFSVRAHHITVSYSGDATFVPSLAEFTQTVLKAPTKITYTGAGAAPYHERADLRATLVNAVTNDPIPSADLTFALNGTESCTQSTGDDGTASCSVVPSEPAGDYPLTIGYAGDGNFEPSNSQQTFTVTKERTALTYTGTTHVANGTPAQLTAVMREDGLIGKAPVGGRDVTLTLGSGAGQQHCAAQTNSDGIASCTIASVDQPLSDAATVPVTVQFDGDSYYLPSDASTVVKLQYMTGRAYGLSAKIALLGMSLGLAPTPDTGSIRTAMPSASAPCIATVSAVAVSSHAVCAGMVTSLAPGTAKATSTVGDLSLGVLGLPAITVSGLSTTSTSTCAGATGTTTIGTLTIAGVRVAVPVAPNSKIDIAGGATLVVNEQTPVAGADRGLTVNALHLTGLGGVVDIVAGSSTSALHNC